MFARLPTRLLLLSALVGSLVVPLAVSLAVSLGMPGSALGSHALQVLEAELGAEPQEFALHSWGGRPAVSVVTRQQTPQGAQQLRLQVLVLDAQGLRVAAGWPLPPQTQHVEPLRLPGRQDGWLLLTGGQWQLAWPEGDHLRQHPLCPCDTIYSHGGRPDAGLRFAYDLDGDGQHEVLLPYSGYLEAYRIVPLVLAPEPLWRALWNAAGHPLPRAKQPSAGFALPDFGFGDANGDGHPDLILAAPQAVQVAALPAPEATVDFGLDGARRALAERGESAQPTPPSLQAALRTLGNVRFTTADAFLNALAQQVPRDQQSDWAPYLLRVMTLARSRLTVTTPYAVPLQGLGSFGKDDRELLLGRADMDGDGVLDLLHAKLLNFGSALSQQNELRWYRGRVLDGQLTFAPPATVARTDAGSFAEVVRPRIDNAPPLALLLATTEVSLGSIMKALASRSVTLQAQLRLWQEGALGAAPITAREFTYSGLKDNGRRAMFLFADLDGDGWRDYLLNLTPDTLTVFLSAVGPPSLERAAFTQAGLTLPSKPERVLIGDLDGDGSEELVLRYRSDFHGALGTRLRVLRYAVH